MIIINEKEFAEDSLKKGLTSESIYKTINILAKYYTQELGCKKKKTKEYLLEFLRLHWPKYQYEQAYWAGFVERSASNAKKHPLYVFSGVRITKSELETIKGVNNKPLEKLAFTLLCLAKLGNLKRSSNNGWVNAEAKDIYTLARVTAKASERGKKIGQLYGLGLIELPFKAGNPNVRVTFINEEDECVLFVSDFRELGYEYLNYCGEPFIRCGDCRILVRNNSKNNRQYCSACAGYVPQEYKIVGCVDCGKKIRVSSKNNLGHRCELCQQGYRKQVKREYINKKRTEQKEKCRQNN